RSRLRKKAIDSRDSILSVNGTRLSPQRETSKTKFFKNNEAQKKRDEVQRTPSTERKKTDRIFQARQNVTGRPQLTLRNNSKDIFIDIRSSSDY
ncbi:MAG: hypothetical protein AB7E95_09685, partial [Kiritimatiellales bacterium]